MRAFFCSRYLYRPFIPGASENKLFLDQITHRYVNITDEHMETDLLNVMSALSMMQQPTYFRMKPHINASQHLLPLLKDINLTDFMLTVIWYK